MGIEKETTLSDRILEGTITRFLSKIKSSDFELETKTVFVKTLSLPKFETLLEIEDISFSSARQIVSLPGMVLDYTKGSACVCGDVKFPPYRCHFTNFTVRYSNFLNLLSFYL